LASALTVGSGGTGATTFGQGWLYSSGGAAALAASTSPTVNYLTATSTTVASQLRYASTTALTVSGNAYFPGSGIWSSSGNVGIGTTNPNRNLTVDTTNLGNLGSIAIKATNNEFDMYVDTSSAWLMTQGSGSTDITLAPNNVAAVTIKKTTGNVGIGTTNPTATLYVNQSSNGQPAAHFYNAGGSGIGVEINVAGTGSGTIAALDVQSGGTSRFRVVQNGNVGIGTTNPGEKLTVSGAANFNYPGTNTGNVRQFSASIWI
jgi:uncharacterized protein YaiE (UPF0345 family)